MKLVLRGHHLLCLKGFQGYGYDENFTRNMTEVNIKRKRENVTVSLVASPDDICCACPNLKDGICEDEIQNERIILDEIFTTEESVSEICFNCLWHEECLFYQNLLNNR